MAHASAGAPAVPRDRADLLGRAWTEAAQLYSQELVPRFDPWLRSALRELLRHSLPAGPLVVPCCGPGHELVLLHRMYCGTRAVYGLDLSQGMVDLARQSIHSYLEFRREQRQQQRELMAAPRGGLPEQAQPAAASSPTQPQIGPEVAAVEPAALEAIVADASCLDGHGPAAAVVSVFGLQQMGPVAPQALASWVRNLAPGGVAVVVMWPSQADPGGPWAAFDQVVLERAAAVAGRPPPPPAAAAAAAAAPAAEWEVSLTEAALRDVAGAELLVDRLEQHSIVWESAAQLWKVMTEGGPWRARRLAQGDQVMSDLEERFLAKMAVAATAANQSGGAGAGAGLKQPRQLKHRPFARVIVIRRTGPSGDVEPSADTHQQQLEQPQPQPRQMPAQGKMVPRVEVDDGEAGAAAVAVVCSAASRRQPQSAL